MKKTYTVATKTQNGFEVVLTARTLPELKKLVTEHNMNQYELATKAGIKLGEVNFHIKRGVFHVFKMYNDGTQTMNDETFYNTISGVTFIA